jgi:ABC-type lipoprotein release transport system permease subunit
LFAHIKASCDHVISETEWTVSIEAIDPSLYAAATMLVIVVAGLACSVPAFRAVRVDPAAVLRSE